MSIDNRKIMYKYNHETGEVQPFDEWQDLIDRVKRLEKIVADSPGAYNVLGKNNDKYRSPGITQISSEAEVNEVTQ